MPPTLTVCPPLHTSIRQVCSLTVPRYSPPTASALREALHALGPGDKLEALRVESALDPDDHRIFLVNARYIEPRNAVLLALTDITEAKRAERAVELAAHGFREMLMNAAQAITMT